jgi:Derlin-2/3
VQDVSLYGLIRVKGFWLPYIILGITFVSGQGGLVETIVGLAVGHLWYFLTMLRPRAGHAGLATPRWVRALAVKLEMAGARPAAPPVNPSDDRFRAFSGRARRLA